MISGALALGYEVLWMRQATLAFGASAPATAATLAAMFLGMAAGSAVLGRIAHRLTRPLLAWGVLEIGVATGALLVRPLFGLYSDAFPVLYQRFSQWPAVFVGAKTALALLAFLPATFCMGGTLPVVAQALRGQRTAFLYAINTLGAALGALAIPFVVLPRLGAARGGYLTIAGSAAIGILAMLLSSRAAGRAPDPGRGPREPNSRSGPTAPIGRIDLALAFLSGLAVLALEALATRALALVHESSVQAFAIVLAIFLLGLGTGGLLARRLIQTGFGTRSAIALAWCASAIAAGLMPRLLIVLTDGMAYRAGSDIIAAAFPLLFPVAVLAGTVFPLLLGRANGGREVGDLLAANTIGSIAGPLVAGFLLGPALGLWLSIATVGAAMALAAILADQSTRTLVAAFGALSLVVIARPALTSPVRINPGDQVIAIREGMFGTVSTIQNQDGDRRIKLDNHYVLGGTASLSDERAQTHIPLLLHPNPRSVLFLGLGTGISASASLAHRLDTRVAVELVPEVVAAARADFAEANLGFPSADGVEIVMDDARSFLAGAGRRFDVIIGDLFVPWRPGESGLYTEESFRLSKRALNQGGLYCQWIPLWQISSKELAILLETFLRVFPRASLWRADFSHDGPALALCGETERFVFAPDAIDRSIAAAAPALRPSAPLLATTAGFWLHFLGRASARPGTDYSLANRDAMPRLELRQFAIPANDHEPAGARLEGIAIDSADALLGPERAGWRRAGWTLGRAAVWAVRGDQEKANALGSQALEALPDSTRETVLRVLGGQ